MANEIQPESTPQERKRKIDELNRAINPDDSRGSVISGMTKRQAFSDGNQCPVQGIPRGKTSGVRKY